jgi:hypothetical protein
MALASVPEMVAGVPVNVVTREVETIITLNQGDRFKATEEGVVEPFVTGGGLRATAAKKISLGAVFVQVIITLEQS